MFFSIIRYNCDLISRIYQIVVFSVFLLTGCGIIPHSTQPPFADVHLHFTFDQEEIIDVKDTIKILEQNNVVLGVVSSEPTDYALKMARAGGDWIIPFASPYYNAGNRLNWYFDKNLVSEIRRQLETGLYGGIGEVHLVASIGPRRDNPVFVGLLELAREFKLPFLIHTDASRYLYFLPVCEKYPDIRFIWAHAGGTFQPDQLDPLMKACPNVWLDLAARDPDHYGAFVEYDGALYPGWRDFIIKYQDRIMTGTDPVWNAQEVYRWYESDEGWFHYNDFIQFHRKWMKQLPREVEKKVRLTNAQRFFGLL